MKQSKTLLKILKTLMVLVSLTIISFIVGQSKMEFNAAVDEPALSSEIYDQYDTESKTSKEDYKKDYIDEHGNLQRNRLPVLVQIILSDDDEVAKKELEQLYTMGLVSSLNIPIGDKIDLGSFFHFILTIPLYFITYLIMVFAFVIHTLIPMMLIRLRFGDLIPSIFQMVRDTLIKGFLFKDTGTSIGLFVLILATFFSVFVAFIREKIAHPVVLLKKMLAVLLVGIIGGYMTYYTYEYHKAIQDFSTWAVENTIGTSSNATEVRQKSLIFVLFQEQPFLLRNFGVVKVDDILTRCNANGETPEQQYEGLLLGNGDAKGEDSYEIHQARPAAEGAAHCDNQNIKHRDRKGVEFMVTITSILSSITNILVSLPIIIVLVFSILLTIVGFLRPITAMYSILKTIFSGRLQGLFSLTLNTLLWFLCIPILDELVNYMLIMMIKIIEMMQSVNPFITFIFGIAMAFVASYVVTHLDKVMAGLKGIMQSMMQFSMDGLNPESNLFESFDKNIVGPSRQALEAMQMNVSGFFTRSNEETDDNDSDQNKKGNSKQIPEGDTDIVENETVTPADESENTQESTDADASDETSDAVILEDENVLDDITDSESGSDNSEIKNQNQILSDDIDQELDIADEIEDETSDINNKAPSVDEIDLLDNDIDFVDETEPIDTVDATDDSKEVNQSNETTVDLQTNDMQVDETSKQQESINAHSTQNVGTEQNQIDKSEPTKNNENQVSDDLIEPSESPSNNTKGDTDIT